jgi:hypothetical protein
VRQRRRLCTKDVGTPGALVFITLCRICGDLGRLTGILFITGD